MKTQPIDTVIDDGADGTRRVPGHRVGHARGSNAASAIDDRKVACRHANVESVGSENPDLANENLIGGDSK